MLFLLIWPLLFKFSVFGSKFSAFYSFLFVLRSYAISVFIYFFNFGIFRCILSYSNHRFDHRFAWLSFWIFSLCAWFSFWIFIFFCLIQCLILYLFCLIQCLILYLFCLIQCLILFLIQLLNLRLLFLLRRFLV